MLLRLHHHIVHIDMSVSAELLEETLLHASLKCGSGVSQSEYHGQVTEGSEWRDEGSLQPVGWVQLDLVIPGVCIQKTQPLASGCRVNHLVDSWQSEWAFGSCFVEAGIINTHGPLLVLLQH